MVTQWIPNPQTGVRFFLGVFRVPSFNGRMSRCLREDAGSIPAGIVLIVRSVESSRRIQNFVIGRARLGSTTECALHAAIRKIGHCDV